MTILITGAYGTLGLSLQKEFIDHELLCPTHKEINLTNFDHLKGYLDAYEPDLIINCAAETNVDKCEIESQSIEIEKHETNSYKINVSLVEQLSKWCGKNNKRLLHISSASIFGSYGALSPEIDFNQACPLSEYSRQKDLAESMVKAYCHGWVGFNGKIIRSGWLFGDNTKKSIGQIYEKLKNGEQVRAVSDIYGQIIYVDEMAKFIRIIIDKWDDIPTIIHAASHNTCSRYDIANYLERQEGFFINWNSNVTSCSNREFNLPAIRPTKELMSVEYTERITGFQFKGWQEMLDLFIQHKND